MEIRQIPLSLVSPSPMNPRKTFDEDELQELADNIEKQGLLQPITVRPIADKHKFAVVDGNADFHPEYEIICGERRFRAFSKLYDRWNEKNLTDADGEPVNQFDKISAIVREMNDDEAFDAMITENLQRKDVDPIEEAFAFGQLIQKGKTAEEVAARFGKSIRFVRERIKLNSLIPELVVAVKDGKCPLIVAQLISKIDEEQQKQYYNQTANSYYGFTKNSAENYIDHLFMKIDQSLWYKSDNQEDESFSGGCGHSCAECPLNTANAGCLFYEMKCKDAGQCTDRNKYQAKTLAFVEKEIDSRADELVKAGEPLERGKIVLGYNVSGHENEANKQIFEQVKQMVADKGYEFVELFKTFDNECKYDADDERLIAKVREGKVYRVLTLKAYFGLTVEETYYNVKTGDKAVGQREGVPLAVTDLCTKRLGIVNGFSSKRAVALRDTLKSAKLNEGAMKTSEFLLGYALMLSRDYDLLHKFGLEIYAKPKEIIAAIEGNKDKVTYISRRWLQRQLDTNEGLRIAEPMLQQLGQDWCPSDFAETEQKLKEAHNKALAKIDKQLEKLGYDHNAKKLNKE